jgi:L-seryl-tRNA(Ser) seleniumtransferase
MTTVNKVNYLRNLPPVDEVLNTAEIIKLLLDTPRILVLESVREILDMKRQAVLAGDASLVEMPSRSELLRQVTSLVLSRVQEQVRPNLRRVINVTGVVLHTNLGRAVLSPRAIEAVNEAAAGYTNLEMNLQTGRRGSRYETVEDILLRLTGAEAALVVNNNAAAVLLGLGTLARGKEVIVSRGQLVEIGGSFRIPEVMAQSGAHLVEVGATNKTHPEDYCRAITTATALLLHVHTSNYRIVGFTRETSIEELVEIGRAHDLPVMSDLGSGFLVDLQPYGLPSEPSVQEVVRAGSDIVTFSGDKLLGGPQAGIILGKRVLIDRMKKNNLTRALRVDKMTRAALEATLWDYLEPKQAKQTNPTLNMLTATKAQLHQRAVAMAGLLIPALDKWALVELVEGFSRVGGGAMPTAELPSTLVEIIPLHTSAERLAEMLRQTTPAVVGRLKDHALLLDVRTLQEGEEDALLRSLVNALELTSASS